ncbi:MAG: nucleotidyltransferase domain-containing protein [Deltaproteobacteria bacterium]|jgi:predicted nucleotidyltransferase|nr:nucleotidyltransferase domain-containing protein [Deltaproteobacteria bacterium]
MTLDVETVKAIVKQYADDVRQVTPVYKVILYGSYAKGYATEYSDVDVCFFLASFGDKDKHDILVTLIGLTYKYDLCVEPNVFEISDLYDDNPFVKEVLRAGIEISK